MKRYYLLRRIMLPRVGRSPKLQRFAAFTFENLPISEIVVAIDDWNSLTESCIACIEVLWIAVRQGHGFSMDPWQIQFFNLFFGLTYKRRITYTHFIWSMILDPKYLASQIRFVNEISFPKLLSTKWTILDPKFRILNGPFGWQKYWKQNFVQKRAWGC